MKKLLALLLCLGVVGTTAACDVSSLTEMFAGSSVESTEQSTGESETSTATESESEKDSQSSESDGDETPETPETPDGDETPETPDGDETPDGEVTEGEWNEAVKDEKFNNVTFAYSVVFE